MSADRDRGIRRQKQKRAKQQKKLGRQPRPPIATAPAGDTSGAPVAHRAE